MGWVVEDIGMGRGKHAGVGNVFQVGGSGGTSLLVEDVDDDSPYGPGPGGFPAQGGT